MNTLWLATDRGVIRAAQTAGEWTAEPPLLGDRPVTAVCGRPGLLLAGRSDGVWVSSDEGQHWSPAAVGLDQPHVRRLARHPDDPDLFFAGSEPAGLYRGGAGGWTPNPTVPALRDQYDWFLPYSPAAGCVRGFAFHGDRAYAAVEVGGLLRSDDRGLSWRLAGGSSGKPRFGRPTAGQLHADVHDVIVASDNADRVFAPTGGGIYRSSDGGDTWTLIVDCSYARAIWIDPANPQQLVAGPAGGVGRQGTVIRSDDGGDSWQPADNGLQTPWPQTMVERFLTVGQALLAILDDGTLRLAPRATLQWTRILPTVPAVRAAWLAP